MGLTQQSSSLYLSAAVILCLLLAFVVFRHLVRIWRQDPEEWGHRGGVDLLLDLQLLNWIPGILMVIGLVLGFFTSSLGLSCLFIGMLGCVLQGVVGFSAKFWMDCKSGIPWWRTELVKISLGMGLFILVLWLLMPVIKSERGAWITSDFAGTLVATLMIAPLVILGGLFLRDAWLLCQQHPGEWKGFLLEKWRRHLGQEKEGCTKGEEREYWFQKLDHVDLQDEVAVADMVDKARKSGNSAMLGLVGHRLWRDVGTKELGRPLLEEAAAAGEELACMTLRGERLDKCDLDDLEVVQALVDEAMVTARPGLAYDLGMRLVRTEHVGLGKKLLQRGISEGNDIQVVHAKLACLDYDDVEDVEAMADEARGQTSPFLALSLGVRLRFNSEHKALGRELMVWAAEKEPGFRQSLQSGDDQERILACDLGDPQIRADLEAEAMGGKDGGDFAVTLAGSIWAHDAEAGRRLLLWAEVQGHEYARRMLEDFEKMPQENK